MKIFLILLSILNFTWAEHVIDAGGIERVRPSKADEAEDKILEQKEKELSALLKNDPPIRASVPEAGSFGGGAWEIKYDKNLGYKEVRSYFKKQNLKCFLKIETLIKNGVIQPGKVHSIRPSSVTAGPDLGGAVAIGCDDDIEKIEGLFKKLPSKEKQEEDREKVRKRTKQITEKTGVVVSPYAEYSGLGITAECLLPGLDKLEKLLEKPIFRDKALLSIKVDNANFAKQGKNVIGQSVLLNPCDAEKTEKILKALPDAPSPKRIASYEKMAKETDDESLKEKLLENVSNMKKQSVQYEQFAKEKELNQKKATFDNRFDFNLSFGSEPMAEKLSLADRVLSIPKEKMKPNRPVGLVSFASTARGPTLDGRMQFTKKATAEQILDTLNSLPEEKEYFDKVRALMQRFNNLKKHAAPDSLKESSMKAAMTIDESDRVIKLFESAFSEGKKIKPSVDRVYFEGPSDSGQVKFIGDKKQTAMIPANITAEKIKELFVP